MRRQIEKRQYLSLQVIYASDQMRILFEQVEKVAASKATVLITGESGSGKEVIAKAIHLHSRRRSESWVDINCTALPGHLLESELFGYEKGAFSGAESSKQGLFELANRGTMFLDEIGDLDLSLQVKLLRILDGADYYRLGGVRKVSVDVRMVTATNQNLKVTSAQGKFRFDLYHRLSQIQLVVPPLRERRDDIAPLARLFLDQERPGLRICQSAMDALMAYNWPGNVRELRNVMTRCAVLAAGDEITPDDLPADLVHGLFLSDLKHLSTLGEVERNSILTALELTDGHQVKAAERLGISRRTLQRRVKLYGLARRRPGSASEPGASCEESEHALRGRF